MFRPFVDVGLAKAEIADNKMTTKMALNRALKDGDIDMAEQLSKHVNNTESSEKVSSLKQTYDKADKDELVLNRQLQKELSRFPNNKNLQSELSKIENGARRVDFLILLELAKFYNQSITFFIPDYESVK